MNSRKTYITILSVVSAIAVVFLHTNGCFWNVSSYRYWFTANIIECVFYFAVPIFLMITGANLIDYQERYSTKEYIKKRVKKTLVPFIVWSLIGIIYFIVFKIIDIKTISASFLFNGIFSINPFVSYYWFFIPLFSIYLCIPVIASIDKKKKDRIILYLIIGGLLINSIYPFIRDALHLNLYFSVEFIMCSGCLIYPLIGYILDKHELDFGKRLIIYILGIISLMIMIIGTYIASIKAGTVIDTYKSYWYIPCILYSSSIFVFVKSISKSIKNIKIFEKLSQYTFSIYLIHFFIVNPIETFSNIELNSIIFRLGAPFLIIPICILITYLLRKIPIIKKIVP